MVGSEITASGLSPVHRRYLALGGLNFLIGDGRLNYGTEKIGEFYGARIIGRFFTSFDLQYIRNPAYNRDRGPVWVPSIRLHLELGK